MSYCKEQGKDKIIFATEEYLGTPSEVVLLPDDPKEIDTSNVGAILPNGEINWDCPCLGNLPNGPCGPNFREAFSCWVENKDNEEGFAENCFKNFTAWESCLQEHRDIYKPSNDDATETTTYDSQPPVSTDSMLHTGTDNTSLEDNNIASIENDSTAVKQDSNRAIAAASASSK